ncbi:pogo transposable element with ZNF domain isoform X2 [Paramormyrops kingsleyae]
MADSDLFMECEEEELEPWQQVNDDVDDEEMNFEESSVDVAPPAGDVAAPSAIVPAPEMPAHTSSSSEGIKSFVTLLPSSATPVSLTCSIVAPSSTSSLVSPVTPQITSGQKLILTRGPGMLGSLTVSQVLQPLQVVSGEGGTIGPAHFISTQGMPVQSVTSATPVGLLLNGQQVTLLPAPGGQFIKQVAVTSQDPSRPVDTPTVPAPIAIHSPTPLTQLPLTASIAAQLLSSPALQQNTALNAGSLIVLKKENDSKAQTILRVINAIGTSTVAQIQTLKSFTSNGGTSINILPAANDGKVALDTSDNKVCPRCGAHFRTVEALRGKMCHCCPELRQGLQALDTLGSADKQPALPSLTLCQDAMLVPLNSKEAKSGNLDPEGKLVIMVDDFYYGFDAGFGVKSESPCGTRKLKLKCFVCGKKLSSNIRLMNHMKLHVGLEKQGEMDTNCQHCFRRFPTPLQLQHHVDNVHSHYQSTTKCKICELAFDSEPELLQHMKENHKPGEMPYVCQVCEFRSSFYSDVFKHFCERHQDSCYLMCPFCLRIFKTSKHYQNHYFRHLTKNFYYCDKCRLQFLFFRDKAEHKLHHHNTFRKPKQLEGLSPGTKVTIRTYAVQPKVEPGLPGASVSGMELIREVSPQRTKVPSKLVSATGAGKKQIMLKKKMARSIVDIMTNFQEQGSNLNDHNCMECNFSITDFPTHFPSYVSCSLCHYKTCCSRAYANHMIVDHVPRKITKKYLTLFKEDIRLAVLSCSCGFKTEVGDSMAQHQVKHPDHGYSLCSLKDSSRDGFTQKSLRLRRLSSMNNDNQQYLTGEHLHGEQAVVQESAQVISPIPPSSSHPVPSQTSQPSPIVGDIDMEMAPVEDIDLDSEQEMECEPEVKTDFVDSSNKQTSDRTGKGALTVHQLRILLFALCSGVSQAAEHFKTQQSLIWTWLGMKKRQLTPVVLGPMEKEVVDQIVEWVLTRREQQLPVDEENLFQMVRAVGTGYIQISYDWIVDFLLRNKLGLQTTVTLDRPLFREAKWKARNYIKSVHRQIKSKNFPLSDIGSMDELSIYVNRDMLSSPSLATQKSALQLVGTGVPFLDVVLAVLADGTLLPTMVFYSSQAPVRLQDELPQSILLESKVRGFSHDHVLRLWFERVWQKHIESQDGASGMLVMDTFRAHRKAEFVCMLEQAATLPAIIPAGCSCHLHPLEVCVEPVLRDFLQARWNQMVSQGGAAGARAKDLIRLLLTWLAEALECLAGFPKLLQQSFNVASMFPKDSNAPKLSMQKSMVHTLQKALLVDTKSIDDDIEVKQDSDVASDASEGSVAGSHCSSAFADDPSPEHQVSEKHGDGDTFQESNSVG